MAIGFAITAVTAVSVANQLLDKGQVEHAFIGIQPAQLTPEVALDFRLGESTGVLVYGVTRDGPAVRAGIEPGDVLTRLGGRQLESVEDLYATLRQHRPGHDLRAQFVRGGRPHDVTLVLSSRPQ